MDKSLLPAVSATFTSTMAPLAHHSAAEVALLKPPVAVNKAAIIQAAELEKSKRERTAGLWAVDTLVYPIITNLGVFTISVAATYLTSKGHELPTNNETVKKIGNWFHGRGLKVENFFVKTIGLTKGQAEMSKMVFFSFADGCIMSIPVKLLEDHREEIAKWIDEAWGTKPQDVSIYAAEPKQTWLSVLGGRAATCLIVVPTAVALEKAKLNDIWFKNNGIKLGNWIDKQPNLAKHFKNFDTPELMKTSIFEGVYTFICTAGLYFNSRLIASLTDNKKSAAKNMEPAMLGQQSTNNPVLTEQGQENRQWAKTRDLSPERFKKSTVLEEAKPAESPINGRLKQLLTTTPSGYTQKHERELAAPLTLGV